MSAFCGCDAMNRGAAGEVTCTRVPNLSGCSLEVFMYAARTNAVFARFFAPSLWLALVSVASGCAAHAATRRAQYVMITEAAGPSAQAPYIVDAIGPPRVIIAAPPPAELVATTFSAPPV